MTSTLRLDAAIQPHPDLRDIPSLAAESEARGFAGIWSTETIHDPFLPLALAAIPTQRIELGTAIALSFTRSPMTLAYTAWDLAALSAGRFILGLGTQVKAHIERRFSIPWSAPIPRLREVILSLRAIWQAWRTGERLNFRGEHYRFTLMTPFFTPPGHNYSIPIYIAGVNSGLCELAGEFCEGFHVHPLNSPRYLTEQVRPAISRGAARAGRAITEVTLAASTFVVTGANDRQMAAMREEVRRHISFYASTPSYRVVLDTHGWGGIGEQLSALAARRQWDAMPGLISDEMIETFAVIGRPEQIPGALRQRYSGLVDRVALYLPFSPGEDGPIWDAIVPAFADSHA